MTRKATAFCWNDAFLPLFAAYQILISFSWECIPRKTDHLIKLHKIDIYTFMLQAFLGWFFAGNLNTVIPNIRYLFQQELKLLFIEKFDANHLKRLRKPWSSEGRLKMALNLAHEHRMKSSTKTNQQSIVQMRSHSGYSWMITIFKLNLKVWNK